MTRQLAVLSAVLALWAVDGRAQIAATTDALSRDAMRRAKETTAIPFPLDVQHDIEAGNLLVQLQTKGLRQASRDLLGARPRALRAFRVMSTDFDLVDGKIVGYGLNLSTGPRWLLVFDENSGRWFHLQGFRQALDEFNQLVRLLKVTVDDERDVFALFNLYRTMVKEWGYSDLVVLSEMELLQAGLHRTVRDSPNDRAQFVNRWWSENPDRRRDLTLKRTRLASGDYRVSWYVLNPEMKLKQESIVVHRDGTIGP